MDEKKEDGQMIEQKQEGKQSAASDAEVLKLAKKGMKKYRKTLDKLAKN
ncbi:MULTISPECIES: hypothetical protein [Paenibacillus]|nr:MULTISPECIES: hypothetical protein [Paenibacillus]